MSSPSSVLARALALPCGVTLPNRIAKSAMSESLANSGTNAPDGRHVRLYERWGRGGAGLLITGNVMVSRDGLGEVGNVVVEDERDLDALRAWAEAAQANGAQLWMQINHAGRQSPRTLVRKPVAPSVVPMRGMGGAFAAPRALEHAEIEEIVARFAEAARVAKKAGFSGVQVHGAHGYLVSQFLSPLTNLRDDAWGGDAERRMRFLLEIVRAIRAAVGPEYPIGVKVNSADFQRGGATIDDAIEVVKALERAGVDLVEVSGGSYEAPAMTGRGELPQNPRASSVAREAYFLEYARKIREATKVPLLLTGGMRTAAAMSDAIESGAVDVVGLARPLAHEPDLPARLLDGTAAEATPVRVRSSVRALDDLLQIYWFQAQMHRMADGLEPNPRLSKLCALVHAARMTFRLRASARIAATETRRLAA